MSSPLTNSCPVFGSWARHCGPLGPFISKLFGFLGLDTSEIALLIAYSSDFWVTECIREWWVIWLLLPQGAFHSCQCFAVKCVLMASHCSCFLQRQELWDAPWFYEIQKRKHSFPKAWRSSYRLVPVSALKNLFQRI